MGPRCRLQPLLPGPRRPKSALSALWPSWATLSTRGWATASRHGSATLPSHGWTTQSRHSSTFPPYGSTSPPKHPPEHSPYGSTSPPEHPPYGSTTPPEHSPPHDSASPPEPPSPENQPPPQKPVPFRHLHINTSDFGARWISYKAALEFQNFLRDPFLRSKSGFDQSNSRLLPSLLSFTPAPTYTFGRRQDVATELAKCSPNIGLPLEITQPYGYPQLERDDRPFVLPQFVHAPRGGRMTYHGPGQLVLWPVVDLRSPLHPHFTVPQYVRLLEDTTRDLLRARFKIETFSTTGDRDDLDGDSDREAEPGVWVRPPDNEPDEPIRKIAAVGVHFTRFISGHGIALNVDCAVVGKMAMNPWCRFVPCGLPDRGVTSIVAMVGRNEPRQGWKGMARQMSQLMSTDEIAKEWGKIFAGRLGLVGGAEIRYQKVPIEEVGGIVPVMDVNEDQWQLKW